MDTNKKEYLSYLNVISAISVVILHANGAFWDYSEDPGWFFNNMIECVFYYAVPVFFMITGATLLDYQDRYNTKTYFIKRFKKTVIPFLFWLIIPAIPQIILSRGIVMSDPTVDFETIFNGIINTQYLKIFWFFVPLFCIYLTIPFFGSIEKEKRVKCFTYISAVALMINAVIPFFISLINYGFHMQLIWPYEISAAGNYLIFALLGYVLDKTVIPKYARIIIYILAIAAFLTHCFGTYYLSVCEGHIVELFKGYENLPGILYAVGVYVFVKSILAKHHFRFASRSVAFLKNYSFEFFLMHIYVFVFVRFALRIIGFTDGRSMLYVLLCTLITIPICILVTFILRKIPLVKHVVP